MPLDLQFFADGDGENGTGQESQNQQGAQNAAGAENNQNSNVNDTNGQSPSGDGKPDEKTFTQHQVNAMMAKEKKQGKAAAYAELGIDPSDSKTVAMFKAFVEAQKTSEQKQAEAASKQQALIVDAERRATLAEAKAEALQSGVNPDYVDDCVTVAISKIKDGVTLSDALKELKDKYPIWFGSSDNSANGKTGQKGTGASISKMGSTAGSNGESSLAAKLAAAKKAGTAKSSFWG